MNNWPTLNMQHQWTDEELDALREVFADMYYFEMAEWFEVTEDHIKMICRRLGLVKKRRTAKSYKYLVPGWVLVFIFRNYHEMGNVEIAQWLTCLDDGKEWTHRMVWKLFYHHGLTRTIEQQKAIKERNKQLGSWQTEKHIGHSKGRAFKPGTIKLIGRKQKIVQMKFDGKMMKLGRAVWLKEFGTIPPGHVIRAKANDQYSTDINTWMCISKKENQALNAKMRAYPQEIHDLEKQLSILNSLITKTKKHEHQ